MKLLREINESDIGMPQTLAPTLYKVRRAARGVIVNNEGNIALLWVGKHHFHKLPGGGLIDYEHPEVAFAREALEETGYAITDIVELGMIIEHSNTNAFLQISYCYCAHTYGNQQPLVFTDAEIADDFHVRWVPLTTALDLLVHDTPNSYVGKWIRERDLTILNHAHAMLAQK